MTAANIGAIDAGLLLNWGDKEVVYCDTDVTQVENPQYSGNWRILVPNGLGYLAGWNETEA